MRDVYVPTSGIGDQVEIILLVRPRHDQVIDDPAILIGEDGECTLKKELTYSLSTVSNSGLEIVNLIRVQTSDIGHAQALHELHTVFAVNVGLQHMGDVKDRAVFPGIKNVCDIFKQQCSQ